MWRREREWAQGQPPHKPQDKTGKRKRGEVNLRANLRAHLI